MYTVYILNIAQCCKPRYVPYTVYILGVVQLRTLFTCYMYYNAVHYDMGVTLCTCKMWCTAITPLWSCTPCTSKGLFTNDVIFFRVGLDPPSPPCHAKSFLGLPPSPPHHEKSFFSPSCNEKSLLT